MAGTSPAMTICPLQSPLSRLPTSPTCRQLQAYGLPPPAAGIRYADRTDVLLALFEPGTTTAGVFTRSKCPSAPVEWCRAHLKGAKPRALVVNSGHANAFNGKIRRHA